MNLIPQGVNQLISGNPSGAVDTAKQVADELIGKYVPDQYKNFAGKLVDAGKGLIDRAMTPSSSIDSSLPSTTFGESAPTLQLTKWRKFNKGVANTLNSKLAEGAADIVGAIPLVGGVAKAVRSGVANAATFFADKGIRGKKQKQYDAQYEKELAAYNERKRKWEEEHKK